VPEATKVHRSKVVAEINFFHSCARGIAANGAVGR